MPERTAEPLSPELILVSPPEEAALAREQLPEVPELPRARQAEPAPPNGASEVNWNEFLADVRSRPVEPVAPPRLRPPEPVRRNGRKRLIVAAAAIVAVAVVVGIAWARDRTQQQPAPSSSPKPAPQHRQATAPKAVKPAKHASTTPAPAVRTAAKPKSTSTSKSTSTPSSKHQPRARRAAGFVPTRVWSWAAVPGARAYVVRFLRNGHKVLKIRTGGPRLALPSRFTFAPGRYRWTVTTVSRNGKPGRVIVNSAFTVAAPNG
ncbi:MAG TPA: hypothetical protein VLB89_10525 [Gaiellaceae bacterium]|nr:hypothetical protein [Gaiellaceae bacterium]